MCPPTEKKTLKHAHFTRRHASSLKYTQDVSFSFANFCIAFLKHSVRASSAMPCLGNQKNKIYFRSLALSLSDIGFSDGDEGQRREREMHVISVIKAASAGAMHVCAADTAGAGAD